MVNANKSLVADLILNCYILKPLEKYLTFIKLNIIFKLQIYIF